MRLTKPASRSSSRKTLASLNDGSEQRCFYFNFPWQGSENLVAFLLMKDIQMEPEVEEKVRGHHDAYWHNVMRAL